MSEADERVLQGLRARNLDAVLEELGELARRKRQGEPLRVPLVSLYLDNGVEVMGFVLDVEQDLRGGKWVILHAPGEGSRQVAYDVVHLSSNHIVAITIHDVPGLSGPPEGIPPPPSRLELRRRIGELSAEISRVIGHPVSCEVAWEALPEEGEPLRALGVLMDMTRKVLEEIAGDELGLKALGDQLKVIRLLIGERAEATFGEGTLQVTTAVPPKASISAEELRRAFEAEL